MGDDLYCIPTSNSENTVFTVGEGKKSVRSIDPREYTDAQKEYSASQADTRKIDLSQYQNENGELNVEAAFNRAYQELENSDMDRIQFEQKGYWIGGFKGNNRDRDEAKHIMNRYPEGFAYIANGEEIAMNLSFDPDWNVYTENGRYWWFPSNTNIELYSQFLFGNYPKYVYTVVWNNPQFTSWDFDYAFNWGFRTGWASSGWNFGFGWNYPWYSGWNNSWNCGWYDPWWNYGYNGCYPPYYGHPHWSNPHWGHPGGGNGHYPNWGPPNNRPVNGLRPNHSGSVRPNTNGNYARPMNTNRPSSNRTDQMNRPNSNIRPTNNVRPNSNNERPTTVRPTTRPTENVRPNTQRRSTRTDYSKPRQQNRSTRSFENTSRPQYNQSSRPTYNRQSTPQYNNRGGHSGTVNRSAPPVRRNR